MYAGIDNGYFVSEIADSAYRFEREVNNGSRVIVGVNEFTDGHDGEQNILRIGPEAEEYQRKRLATIKDERDDAAVEAALAAVTAAAEDENTNLMPSIIAAVKVYATLEEVSMAMEKVFGTYVEKVVL